MSEDAVEYEAGVAEPEWEEGDTAKGVASEVADLRKAAERLVALAAGATAEADERIREAQELLAEAETVNAWADRVERMLTVHETVERAQGAG
ncbi:MAG: hypothetical protein IJT88_09500 [Kiritimatiellae bacterium]|nr:hypothetical protein [Kiritimatiellia bacterium]